MEMLIQEIATELERIGYKTTTNILARVFADYLGLPDFFKLKLAKLTGKMKVYSGGRGLTELWRDSLGPYWEWKRVLKCSSSRQLDEGMSVCLEDVTLHEFIPRKPGFRYLLPDKTITGASELLNLAKKFFPSIPPAGLETYSEYVKEIGLTDIRLKPRGGLHLLGATAKEYAPSSFPLLLSHSAFTKLRPMLNSYGAVHVERISGVLQKVPSIETEKGFKIVWGCGIVKDLFLNVKGVLQVGKVGTPDKITGDAWTIINMEGKENLIGFGFPLGVSDWEATLKYACEQIEDLCKEKNTVPMSNFDEEVCRFHVGVKFSPADIFSLRRTLSKK